MSIEHIIAQRRSIRNFSQRKIAITLLKKLIGAARLAPSAANRQFLEYLLITKPRLCSAVFKQLAWAGYIAPRGNPPAGGEPVAYVAILINTKKASLYDLRDVGAAAQNIMLMAQSLGIGSCWLGSIKRARLRKILAVPEHLHIDTIIALGYPRMKSVIAPYRGSIKYYLDTRGVLHVPKRQLRDILHMNTVG